MKTKPSIWAAIALSAILCLSSARGQSNIGQWDFENQDLSQTSGANLGPLTYADGPNGTTSNLTVFGTTTALGVPNIAGDPANIMQFPGNTALPVGYLMPTPPANGGGSLVNDYTVIVDVLYTNSGIFRPILQMDDGTFDNILAFFGVNLFDEVTITNTSGIALPSGAFGKLLPNTWYRLGLVVNTDAGEVDVYTNGNLAGFVYIGTGQLDSPYALYPGDLPLFSSTLTNISGYANSVQLRDVALNAGQMAALGPVSASGIPITIPPVSTFVQKRIPFLNDTNVLPQPSFNIILNQGDTTVDPNSIQLYLDGVPFPAFVANTAPTFTITGSSTNLMNPGSVHTVTVAWTDSAHGAGSNSWSFTVFNYQDITLPAPFYFENFDEVAEGSLPTGWYGTNNTAVQGTNYDLCDPTSAAYEGWLVIDTNRLCGGGPCGGFECDTLNQPPIVLNGALIPSLASNNVLYFESDNRCSGCYGQAGWVFTPDIDCTGQSNVYVCFNSLWMQNRNSFGTLEYSVNQGSNWLPALYCITDSDGNNFSTMLGAGGSRIIYTNGVIDITATFYTSYTDQVGANGGGDGDDGQFVLAPITTNIIPFIQGFPDDGANYTTTGGGVQQSQWIGKEIEHIRLVSADNQKHVRFRFGYTGRCSWYWGVDNFGLYSINTPVISVQPQSITVNAATPAVFSVTANGQPPLTYQWMFNGHNILNATNATYTIASAAPTNVGTYTVVVRNADGPTTSEPATLAVTTTPSFTSQPSGEIADLGGSVSFTGSVIGGVPISYSWLFNGSVIETTTNPVLTLNNLQLANVGNYQLAAANSYGAITSTVAILKVWAGPITSNLVVHLPFDNDLNDYSGRGNNATYMYNGELSSTTPRFTQGIIGSNAFEYTTTSDYTVQEYASFGYPPDLQLGASQDFSVSFWCKYTNQYDDLPFISNKDWDSSSNPGWGIFTQSGGNYRINVTGPNQGLDKYSETDTPSDLKDGNWHNILVSFQRAPFGQTAFVYGYLDGVLASKHPMAVTGTIDTYGLPFTDHQSGQTPVQTEFAVNVGQDGTGNYADNGSAHDINAAIDDMGIWRRALTPNEARAIYAAGQNGNDLTQAVSSMLFIKVSGNTALITWVGEAGVQLESSPSLSNPVWTMVNGSLGASSASVPMGSNAAFFRLHKVQ